MHDLTFFDHPEWHERSKVVYFRRMIRAAARRADVIVTGSNDAARGLKARFRTGGRDRGGAPRRRSRPFLDRRRSRHRLRRARPPRHHEPIRRVRQHDRTAQGRTDPRARVRAHRGRAPRPPPRARGRRRLGRGRRPRRDRSQRRRHPRHPARATSPTPPSRALFRRAEVIAYPSFVEGFGMPALEALASGTPLVTTTGSSLEEVVGDAALLVPPADTEALARALASVLDDPARRGAAARRRARRAPRPSRGSARSTRTSTPTAGPSNTTPTAPPCPDEGTRHRRDRLRRPAPLGSPAGLR